MKKRKRTNFYVAATLLAAFVLWTFLLRLVDVQPIGPQGASVGFATLNRHTHALVGVNMTLYAITDWLGLVPFGTALGFAALGLVQWIKRKGLSRVDRSIWVLGGFYILVMAVYVFFEIVPINQRPVLIDGVLETSYPSSTTMLVACVMPSALMQLNTRIQNRVLRRCVACVIVAFVVSMIVLRFLSGVHWLTDIIGGVLISAGLVWTYRFISESVTEK